MKKKFIGQLTGNNIIITDLNAKSQLVQRGFGDKYPNYLSIDVFEALYLIEQKTLTIKKDKKTVKFNELISIFSNKSDNKYILQKYEVFKDVRSKGHIVKTGFKFGFDFRVYPKGKKITEEHSQYVIDVLPENEKIKCQYFAKSLRMAIGLHTTLIIAIVDNDLDISYYEMARNKF